MKLKIILTIGISGSGKTTWAEDFIKNNQNWVNINRDDIRFLGKRKNWSNYKFSKDNEEKVTRLCDLDARLAADNCINIIISDTNLNKKTRDKWKKFSKENGYEYEEKVFNISYEEALKRNLHREAGVSSNILWSQYLSMRKYLGEYTYTPNEKLPKALICDVDGTIADMEGVRGPFDWKKVKEDKPREHVISMVQGLIESGLTPIFLSGRDGVCSKDTYDWIMENVMQWYLPEDHGFHLYMRTEKDSRKDSIVKEELFKKYVEGNFNVVMAIDDRPVMIRKWYEIGIPNVVSVADPLKEF